VRFAYTISRPKLEEGVAAPSQWLPTLVEHGRAAPSQSCSVQRAALPLGACSIPVTTGRASPASGLLNRAGPIPALVGTMLSRSAKLERCNAIRATPAASSRCPTMQPSQLHGGRPTIRTVERVRHAAARLFRGSGVSVAGCVNYRGYSTRPRPGRKRRDWRLRGRRVHRRGSRVLDLSVLCRPCRRPNPLPRARGGAAIF
jgi:hypothetical protein